MSQLRSTLTLLAFVVSSSACTDTPTSPEPENLLTPSSLISIAVTPDPTLVTFNSASCTLTNSFTGAVNCSWNISNPALNSLNMWAQVVLTVSYDCVNPHNGRIASSEQRDIETFRQFFGVSDATLTGTNVPLPQALLPTNLRGQDKKLNACKGNGVPVSLVYALTYWDVSVITTSGTQRFSCFASDNRLGCFT